jgi:hypothetical protein
MVFKVIILVGALSVAVAAQFCVDVLYTFTLYTFNFQYNVEIC